MVDVLLYLMSSYKLTVLLLKSGDSFFVSVENKVVTKDEDDSLN